MKRVEVEVAMVHESNARNNSFAVVLIEKGGMRRRLPIIIGSPEAQAIAIMLEKFQPSRPLTHDLFVDLGKNFDISVNEVTISDLKNGVFYALISVEKEGKTVEIDSRSSDAVAIALRADCPIYVQSDILEETGVEFGVEEDIDAPEEFAESEKKVERSRNSLAELEHDLEEAIANEEYERAARLRDEIERIKNNI